MPDRMPEAMPDRMLEDMPDRMPEGMPDKMSDRLPEDMPDKVPECLPDRMPEDMPEDMPDRLPEDMPDRMPEDMPDKVPEGKSEDLPVTKCINVMVGITRSKVICYEKKIKLQNVICNVARRFEGRGSLLLVRRSLDPSFQCLKAFPIKVGESWNPGLPSCESSV